jgi:predicted O-linked N-acetylglucosamine transferase (SPINDLY family)
MGGGMSMEENQESNADVGDEAPAEEQPLQQAIAMQRAGRLEEAEQLYLAILRARPEHPEANHGMGVLACLMKGPAAGLPYLIAALNADPSRGEYWLSYIDALHRAGQPEEAREVLALARQHGLEGAEVEALAGRLEGGAQVMGQPGESLPVSAQNSKKSPKAKPDKLAKKPAHQGKNPDPQEIDTLVSLFSKGQFAEAVSLAQSMTVRFPSSWVGWKMLGVLFQQMGRNADALAPMQKAAVLLPHDAEAHNNLGITLQNLNRLTEAEASYRRALRIKPDYAQAHNNLGSTLQGMNRLGEAEAGYRQAVSIDPDYARAHYNLGLLLQHLGRLDEAEACYRRALALRPDYVDAYNNLGVALRDMGRHGDAEASYRQALALRPDYVEAHCNLGLVLRDMRRLDDAEASLRRAVALQPDYADAYNNLGATLKDMGRLSDAEASYRKALEIRPDLARAHSNLGVILHESGRLAEAEACYRKALEAKPDYAEAHYNLGLILQQSGRLVEAEASYRSALALKPGYAEAYNNLGSALSNLGRLDEAEASLRQALVIRPDYDDAYCNLGLTLRDMKRLDEAEASLRRALAIRPDYAEAYCNLGAVFQDQGRLIEAETCYRKAIEIKPDFTKAHSNLGVTLQDLGQLDEAEASYQQALRIDPDYANAHGNLLFALNYHPDRSAEEIYRAYQQYDADRGIPLRSTWREHGNDRDMNRRLRVGYVSPDFKNHSCRHFLEPLLAHHDKARVEVFAYAELVKEDEMTVRYKNYVEHWIPTSGMSDAALAERIRGDGIDILVELAGHTAGNRLLVFARKPAPVSLSWLGYGYTTGLSTIDYYLTDEISAPIGSEKLFAEHLWRIATPAYAYRPAAGMGEVNSLPAQRLGYVTFGTLTRSIRVNHRTIRVWADILKAVPDSRLVMDSLTFKDLAMQERLATQFAQHGIARDRLEMGFHSPPWDVLRGIDIGLDCFPHNSGTTLFETLYMGVPYITLAGRPSVGRLGSSILHGVGHPEWIAASEADYVAKAVELAGDVAHLSEVRAALRGQFECSPLRDEKGFAGRVEEAYRGMWKNWCEKGD